MANGRCAPRCTEYVCGILRGEGTKRRGKTGSVGAPRRPRRNPNPNSKGNSQGGKAAEADIVTEYYSYYEY